MYKHMTDTPMKNLTYPVLILFVVLFSSCDEENTATDTIKLAYYIESYDMNDVGFEPSLQVEYKYDNSGKLAQYTVFAYNSGSGATEEQRYFTFSYSGENLATIKGFLPRANSPYVEYSYAYLPNKEVLKITQNDHASGITSDVTLAYADDGTVKASYVFSNGGSFQYEFDYGTGNILTDKTTRGSELCSEGEYTYDTQKNPFNSLGYVDYLLTNVSLNNKVTESVSYVGCAFPTLIPESYTYEYDEEGYPISATTFYKSDGSVKRSKKEFFYRSK
jgi:hypothetical protein